jgi:hypothetical protein
MPAKSASVGSWAIRGIEMPLVVSAADASMARLPSIRAASADTNLEKRIVISTYDVVETLVLLERLWAWRRKISRNVGL